MKVLPFNLLGKVSREDIANTKQRIRDFLESHQQVIFAAFYGGVITEDYDEYSDIDVFVIYTDMEFIYELRNDHHNGLFGKADIEWNLVPYTLLKHGIAKDKNYIETIKRNHEYITGNQGLFLSFDIDEDPLNQFLLRKMTGVLNFYVNNARNLEFLSKILRSVDHIPRKLMNYTGVNKDECRTLYVKTLEEGGMRLPYIEILKGITNYKEKSRSTKTEREYNDLVSYFEDLMPLYVFWLHDVILENQIKKPTHA